MSDYAATPLPEDILLPPACRNTFKPGNSLLLAVLIDQENNVQKQEVPSNLWPFLSS